MDELEQFLMQDEEEEPAFWPENLQAATADMSLSIDEQWRFKTLETDRFESDLLSLLEEDEIMTQPALLIGTMNDGEQERDLISCSLPESDFQEQMLQQQQHQQQQQQQQQQEHQRQEKQGQQQQQQQEEEEVEGDDKETESDDKKNDESCSRNLESERKRRKRLNHLLFTLRSLVPNITKMDKRSILVDALAYLQGILQQIEKMEQNNLSTNLSCEASSSNSVEDEERPPQTQENHRYDALPAISETDVEMLDEERSILKIGCNKAAEALGQVQRAIEMLGMEITFVSVSELDHAHMLTTTMLRVDKKEVATREKLLQSVKANAAKLGLVLPPGA